MHVGFGITALIRGLNGGGVDGIGTYALELMKHLAADEQVIVYPYAFGVNNLPHHPCPFKHLAYFKAGTLLSVSTGLSFWRAGGFTRDLDLIHATDHLIPKVKRVPVVATLMDAIPLAHPGLVGYRFRSIKNALWRRTAKFATHIITISEYSKDEISDHFGLPKSRISVVPLGVDERWFVPPLAERVKQIRIKYSLPERYFLFVGTLQPRKNLRRVVAAHRALPGTLRLEFPLVVVGRAGWGCEDIIDILNSRSESQYLHWLKYVPDEDLPAIFSSGTALVFPSLYEGFGLPVLEAFASGLPVITSKTTALLEIAGDAALLVDPLDTDEIGASMQRVAESPELARTLCRMGIERARGYSWVRTAEKTVEVYRSVCS